MVKSLKKFPEMRPYFQRPPYVNLDTSKLNIANVILELI